MRLAFLPLVTALLAVVAAAQEEPDAARKPDLPRFTLELRTSEPRIRSGQLETVVIAKNFALDPQAVARSRSYNKISAALRPELERIFRQLERRTPQDAVWRNVQGRWIATQQSGWTVDRDATEAALRTAFASGRNSARVRLRRTEPGRSVRDFAERGILYHFGGGSSSFRGSPPFRVKNIVVGAQKLSGDYLEDGEEYDFNRRLGPTTRANGFVPGYVISGGTLVLEDGGGVCQVSTTLFRAAYQAGLPITERHAHSHRVTYYDPVGYEATVYAPYKNLKFKNDSGGTLYVQASWDTAAQTLRFDLFGPRNEREVAVSQPMLSDERPAAAPSYTADPSVRPGGQRQVDVAARGVTSVIRRSVRMPGGEVRKDQIKSVYRPWGAVYAVHPSDPRLN
ncbi:vancomycin resistance protein YoaR [Deinobacterium chartae]|uniref:Vancomycin resistance protein YoaR n=1 Tax=Deinobacterium chartae TaxID=521158 RepID=A0A841I2J8_9DEIO|nr:VanW family protein [Deinobacterium chartae]MBB6098568.1 vancomycin resistance protein YoaR [Deinobacterium chartae]